MDVSEERIISSHTGGSDCVLAPLQAVGLRRLVFQGTIDGDAGAMAELNEEDLRFLFSN